MNVYKVHTEGAINIFISKGHTESQEYHQVANPHTAHGINQLVIKEPLQCPPKVHSITMHKEATVSLEERYCGYCGWVYTYFSGGEVKRINGRLWARFILPNIHNKQ